MSGWELANAIRQKNEMVPIAVVTAGEKRSVLTSRKRPGVDWVITKPFHAERIAELAQEISLPRHRSQTSRVYNRRGLTQPGNGPSVSKIRAVGSSQSSSHRLRSLVTPDRHCYRARENPPIYDCDIQWPRWTLFSTISRAKGLRRKSKSS